jgi:ABC-type dipeptide/oligopeptide/nickel transport system ATPase component
MIAGFETITSGDIFIRGQRINDLPPERRPTSMIFQNYALFPHMTVRATFASASTSRRCRPPTRDAKVDRILEKLGLTDIGDRRRSDCPAAKSSASRWRAAWWSSRTSCCSTSRWARSTPICARASRTSSSCCSAFGITFVFVTHAFGVDVDAVGRLARLLRRRGFARRHFARPVRRRGRQSRGLLKLFERFGIKTTWFIPGHSIETFPEEMQGGRRRRP